jgi:hypothetical protein
LFYFRNICINTLHKGDDDDDDDDDNNNSKEKSHCLVTSVAVVATWKEGNEVLYCFSTHVSGPDRCDVTYCVSARRQQLLIGVVAFIRVVGSVTSYKKQMS